MNEENKEKETKDLVPIQDDLDIFKKFDELDDSLVLTEVEKKVQEVWVYHFKQSGHEIWGLAKEGVDQCTIAMGKQGIALREGKVTFEIDPTSPEHVIFTAVVSKHLIDKTGQEAMIEQQESVWNSIHMLTSRLDAMRQLQSQLQLRCSCRSSHAEAF